MKETYVIWKGPLGEKQYTEFTSHEQAYKFMLEKLSAGSWACISDRIKVHKSENNTNIIRS